LSFYEEISQYYDMVFPVGQAQVNFITKAAGKPPKALLDVACGTGGYSLALARQGYAVTAVDLDSRMIEELKAKIDSENLEDKIHALQGDMLELGQKLDRKFDLAFCIGNSLVHLEGTEEIQQFLTGVKNLLVPNGRLIIQIINYDRVLGKNISSLPLIEDKQAGLTFERYYRLEGNKVMFKTILTVPGKQLVNEIPLYPVLSEELSGLLTAAGFTDLRLYGDFRRNEFDKENSYALVIEAS